MDALYHTLDGRGLQSVSEHLSTTATTVVPPAPASASAARNNATVDNAATAKSAAGSGRAYPRSREVAASLGCDFDVLTAQADADTLFFTPNPVANAHANSASETGTAAAPHATVDATATASVTDYNNNNWDRSSALVHSALLTQAPPLPTTLPPSLNPNNASSYSSSSGNNSGMAANGGLTSLHDVMAFFSSRTALYNNNNNNNNDAYNANAAHAGSAGSRALSLASNTTALALDNALSPSPFDALLLRALAPLLLRFDPPLLALRALARAQLARADAAARAEAAALAAAVVTWAAGAVDRRCRCHSLTEASETENGIEDNNIENDKDEDGKTNSDHCRRRRRLCDVCAAYKAGLTALLAHGVPLKVKPPVQQHTEQQQAQAQTQEELLLESEAEQSWRRQPNALTLPLTPWLTSLFPRTARTTAAGGVSTPLELPAWALTSAAAIDARWHQYVASNL